MGVRLIEFYSVQTRVVLLKFSSIMTLKTDSLVKPWISAFFHYWSQNKWLSFAEHISAKLSVELDCSVPKCAKLEIMRSTGVIMVCSFINYIDWRQ